MPTRIRQSAAMMVVVLALFLVGSTAQAGWVDWLWPFGSSVPQTETPEAGAQTPPPGGTFTPPPSGGTGGTPPPSGNQGFQPQQPQQQPQPQQPQQTNTQQQPPPQEQRPNQPRMGDQGQQNQPEQQEQPAPQPGSRRFFCNSLGREASKDECDGADKAKGFQPGQQGEVKPPFPQGDEERMKKEQGERFRTESEQSRKQEEGKMRKEEMMKKENEMRREQKEPMPFPGQGKTEGMFPGKGATEGNFPGGKEGQRPMMNKGDQQQPQEFNFDQEQEQPREVFIDPQFVKQVGREISDQKRELNRLLKAAKKLTDGGAAAAQIQELLAKVDTFMQTIKAAKGEELQEAIDDFHNEQIWDSLNGLRARIELPKQLKEFTKSLTRVERLVKQKSFKKLAEFGVDLEKVSANIAAFREKASNVQSLLNAGNGEEAQEAMQEVWEDGTHPGEIEGALQQMRGMTDGLRRIKNKEILAQMKEVFEPVITAMNEGEYREANQLLNEMQFEMQRIFAQLYRLNTKSKLSGDLKSKLEAFEARIQDKLQNEAPKPSSTESEGGGEF